MNRAADISRREIKWLAEHRKLLKETKPFVKKHTIWRIVRELALKFTLDRRFSKKAIYVFQEAACAFMHELFVNASRLTWHARRTTLMIQDLRVLGRIRKANLPEASRYAIPKAALARVVREIAKDLKPDTRFSKDSMEYLQAAVGEHFSKRFAVMSMVAEHANRVTVNIADARIADQLARNGVSESDDLA